MLRVAPTHRIRNHRFDPNARRMEGKNWNSAVARDLAPALAVPRERPFLPSFFLLPTTINAQTTADTYPHLPTFSRLPNSAALYFFHSRPAGENFGFIWADIRRSG